MVKEDGPDGVERGAEEGDGAGERDEPVCDVGQEEREIAEGDGGGGRLSFGLLRFGGGGGFGFDLVPERTNPIAQLWLGGHERKANNRLRRRRGK